MELAHLLHEADKCPNEYQRHELKALLLVEGFGGPRTSETVGSCFKDLSLKIGVCRIPKGKGNKERDTVFVQSALDEILWLKNYRKARDSDPIFLSRHPGRRGYQLSDFKDGKEGNNPKHRMALASRFRGESWSPLIQPPASPYCRDPC